MINEMEGSPSVLSKFFKKEVSNCRGMCSATSRERTFGIGRWWFWNSHFIRCLTPSLMFIRLSHWMMILRTPSLMWKQIASPPHDSKLSETGPVPACSKIQVATQVGLELNRNTQPTTTHQISTHPRVPEACRQRPSVISQVAGFPSKPPERRPAARRSLT